MSRRSRKDIQRKINTLNVMTCGLEPNEVEWNTPGAWHLTSHQPGVKRIYAVERNSKLPGDGGAVVFSGYFDEVFTFLSGVITGIHLTRTSNNG